MLRIGNIVEFSNTNNIGVITNTYFRNDGKQYCEILELNNINIVPSVHRGYIERVSIK